MPNLRKPVFVVTVWWNSWSPPMHRRRPQHFGETKDSVVNALAEMKKSMLLHVSWIYPFPFFFGLGGDITRDIPVCFLTCPLNVVRGEKNKTVTEKRLGWKGTLGLRGECSNAPTRCRRIRDIVGVARAGRFFQRFFPGYLKDTHPPPPMFHEQKVKV